MSDAALGTELAWSEFQTRLRGYVASRVEAAWADDVVGDILLRLVEHQGSLRRARNPLAWTYRVAANVIADHYRRRAAESRALQLAGAEAEASLPAPGVDDGEAVQQGLAQCLLPFVLALPPKYAEALILTELQGLSQAAAAAPLGLSLSGMKSRVQRGRALLKQRLLRCFEFELDRRGRVMDVRPRGTSALAACGSGTDQRHARVSMSKQKS